MRFIITGKTVVCSSTLDVIFMMVGWMMVLLPCSSKSNSSGSKHNCQDRLLGVARLLSKVCLVYLYIILTFIDIDLFTVALCKIKHCSIVTRK